MHKETDSYCHHYICPLPETKYYSLLYIYLKEAHDETKPLPYGHVLQRPSLLAIYQPH